MKRKKIFIIIGVFVIALICSRLYNRFFTKGMITGTYVNINYNYEAGGKMPHVPDTLELLENGEFISPYWGNGTYEISYSIKGTNIDLKYKYEFGFAGYSTYITRIWYGKPKIIMFMDLGHYYEKSD